MQYIINSMRSLFDFDAVQVLWFCNQNNKYYEILRSGYNRLCAQSLAYDFPKIYPQGFSKIFSADQTLPLSISASATLIQPAFTDSLIYKNYLNKSGFQDGMTLELNDNNQYIGLVHFSSFRENHFNPYIQKLVYHFQSMMIDWFKQHQFLEHVVNQHKFYIFNEKNGFAVESLNTNQTAFENEVREAFFNTYDRLKTGYWLLNNEVYKIGMLQLPNENFVFDLSPAKLPYGLSKKEMMVLSWLIVGLSDKEIAKKLLLGERTINSHVLSIYRKLAVNNRIEAAVFAVVHGIYIPDKNGIILTKITA